MGPWGAWRLLCLRAGVIAASVLALVTAAVAFPLVVFHGLEPPQPSTTEPVGGSIRVVIDELSGKRITISNEGSSLKHASGSASPWVAAVAAVVVGPKKDATVTETVKRARAKRSARPKPAEKPSTGTTEPSVSPAPPASVTEPIPPSNPSADVVTPDDGQSGKGHKGHKGDKREKGPRPDNGSGHSRPSGHDRPDGTAPPRDRRPEGGESSGDHHHAPGGSGHGDDGNGGHCHDHAGSHHDGPHHR